MSKQSEEVFWKAVRDGYSYPEAQRRQLQAEKDERKEKEQKK
jgi:hypothetical protein